MASEFLRLYPGAHILVTSERDFTKNRRKEFTSRLATMEYDCVIMSHSQFERIPISPDREKMILQRQLDEILMGIDELKARTGEHWTGQTDGAGAKINRDRTEETAGCIKR